MKLCTASVVSFSGSNEYNDGNLWDSPPTKLSDVSETNQSRREVELIALVKKLQSDLDLFKNALGQPQTLSLEGETLNGVNVELRAQDIVAMTNQFQTHPGNIMLNNLIMQTKNEYGKLPHRKHMWIAAFVQRVKDLGMRFLIEEGAEQYRLATGQESHDSVQRRFQRKKNGSIRALPGFTIECCGNKEEISRKKKTKSGKRKSNTGKDRKGKVNRGEDWVRRSERIQSKT